MAICGSANWSSGSFTSVMERACGVDKMAARGIRKDKLIKVSRVGVGGLFVNRLIKM